MVQLTQTTARAGTVVLMNRPHDSAERECSGPHFGQAQPLAPAVCYSDLGLGLRLLVTGCVGESVQFSREPQLVRLGIFNASLGLRSPEVSSFLSGPF